MKKIQWSVILFVIISIIPIASYANEWAKTYGGSNYDSARSVQQTQDGGYIFAGETNSFGAGDKDCLVTKLDSGGSVEWQKTYGGSNYEDCVIQSTSDGGYILGGGTNSVAATYWVAKLDSGGSVEWQKTYGSASPGHVVSIKQTADDGYIVAGETQVIGAGWNDYWILKLNSDGSIVWQKNYPLGSASETPASIQQTSDGGYIIGGDTNSPGVSAGSWDFWVLKLNSSGEIEWSKTYGGPGYDRGFSIHLTSDGGYIVGGETASAGAGGVDFWALKLNPDGTVAWQKAYGGSGNEAIFTVEQTSDNGFIVTGYSKSFGGGALVLKLNPDGTIAWQKAYGGGSDEAIFSVEQTSDNGFIMAGLTSSFGAGNYDAWILKLDSNGEIPGCSYMSDPTVIVTPTFVTSTPANVVPVDTNVEAMNATIPFADTVTQTSEICWACIDSDGDGYCESEGDCDDNNPTVNPGAYTETCNGIDDNCDGNVDEIPIILDDFEDGIIDVNQWVVGGATRGWDMSQPTGIGNWSYSNEEIIDPSDGYLNLRVWGPTSGNSYGAESWVRTNYNFNDGKSHIINFTWRPVVDNDLHYNAYFIQITDDLTTPSNGSVHWAGGYDYWPGTVNLLTHPTVFQNGWYYDASNPGYPTPDKFNWSISIDPSGVARLYDAPNATGNIISKENNENLDLGYSWYVRFMVIDATSAGFPAGDSQLILYNFSDFTEDNIGEICNGVDDNCDGNIDEGFNAGDICNSSPNSCGDYATGSYVCTLDGSGTECNAVQSAERDGYGDVCVSAPNNCGDTTTGVNVCAEVGVVCNAVTPTDRPQATAYIDADGDGYGDINSPVDATCVMPSGAVLNSLDCDDTKQAINPDATEICNNIDDNCDGNVDEGFDQDGDGYKTCEGDCNDLEGSINPGVAEICDDGIDNNCDGKEDVTPVVGAITMPADPLAVGGSITASADFTDANLSDVHTATWDWGDSTTYDYVLPEGARFVEESHTYTTPGVYTVTLSISEGYCGGDTSIYQYVVVYDPEGGFVTGGGWIMSPEDAYTSDPSLTGKANFGFVSKYKKGATIPTGQTQFQFKVADLNFHSDSYDWLVVAGAKAKYKGVGTINGEGEYKFMLSAIDADINDNDSFEVDRFRIKIWTEDVNGNETVVYDNAVGSDDDNAMTEIGGGSIVIHKKN